MVHLRIPKLATQAALALLLASSINNSGSDAFTLSRPSPVHHQLSTPPSLASTTALFGKKRKGGTPRPNPNYSGKKKGGGQPQQEKASVKEARFDAATRQFMFTLVGLSKTLPDKSKDILKNINLSFYPGAKIVSVIEDECTIVSVNVTFDYFDNVS